MVEDIREQYAIEVVIGMRDPLAVEEVDRDQRVGSQPDVDPADSQIGPALAESACQGPVPASDVEQGALVG